jgi:hypothetical protein
MSAENATDCRKRHGYTEMMMLESKGHVSYNSKKNLQ